MGVDQALEGAGLALLASVSVSMWTLRVAAAASGWRLVAAVIAALEAVLFVVVFGSVVSSVDDPVTVTSYALGVAAGTLAGMAVGDRIGARHAHEAAGEQGRAGGDVVVASPARVAARRGVPDPARPVPSGAITDLRSAPDVACARCALVDALATPCPPGVALPGSVDRG